MYNKNKCQKIMFQAIVDNKVGIEFNTSKKRDAFIIQVDRMKDRRITCVTNVSYPWNLDDGVHNLKSPEDFAKILNYSVDRVKRAITNGYLQTEKVGNQNYIVSNKGTYLIKGSRYDIE